MNIRAVSVFDQYDLEVLRTGKVRGAILCEAKEGLLLLKEYQGQGEKIGFLNEILLFLREKRGMEAEFFLCNKEGAWLSKDYEGNTYLVKSYREGRECDVSSAKDGMKAMEALAGLHHAFKDYDTKGLPASFSCPDFGEELRKRNRELKKIQKYLYGKKKKSPFEFFLMENYGYFLNQAQTAVEKLEAEQEMIKEKKQLCHGDFQYHNVLFQIGMGNPLIINYEKCCLDYPDRDLYLFLRKILEKQNWSTELGRELLKAYDRECRLTQESRKRLYYRLLYPEKFWKIVNYYYNSNKAFISVRNGEKLLGLLDQEEKKNRFMERFIF